jgi:hypothetical protein
LIARLKREGLTELAAAVEREELSALAAAYELGWYKRPATHGVLPNRGKRRAGLMRNLRRQGVLPGDADELGPVEKMELIIGPAQWGSVFPDRDSLHRAWLSARDELLQRSQAGRRPAGFYEFEWEGDRPPYDLERSELWRRGLLTEEEKAALEAEWRTEWDFCHQPGFAIARAWPNSLLKGAAARREHLAWADVPCELVQDWTAMRQAKKAAPRVDPPALGSEDHPLEKSAPPSA